MTNDIANRKLLSALGIAAFYIVLTSLPAPENLSPEGMKSIALMLCAVLTWVSNLLPIAVSSILFTLLTVVTGTVPLDKAMSYFATPTIFFVFAMFCIAIAFQKSGLARRITLWISLKSHGSPQRLLFFIMMVSALLSSFLADIPVCAMMLPICLQVLDQNGCKPGDSAFGKALMLGLPLACTIGGVGTPAGSAVNILAIGMLQDMAQVDISFFKWMVLGIPMVLLITPVTCFVLLRVFHPEMSRLAGMDEVERQFKELGPLTRDEIFFLILLAVNFLLWCSCSLAGLSLPVAAFLGSVPFALPRVYLIDWTKDKNHIAWDILMLIGAANALGMILFENGGATWLVDACLGGITGLHVAVFIGVISLFTIVAHLVIPVITALVAVLMPAVVVLAGNMGVNPALLALPMTFSVSAAFLLPLDSVPLVTYPAGYYRMYDMFKPGVYISLAWVVILTPLMMLLAPPLGLL